VLTEPEQNRNRNRARHFFFFFKKGLAYLLCFALLVFLILMFLYVGDRLALENPMWERSGEFKSNSIYQGHSSSSSSSSSSS